MPGWNFSSSIHRYSRILSPIKRAEISQVIDYKFQSGVKNGLFGKNLNKNKTQNATKMCHHVQKKALKKALKEN